MNEEIEFKKNSEFENKSQGDEVMYKSYLGAFGNKSFIRPQFEILEDGSLREIGGMNFLMEEQCHFRI